MTGKIESRIGIIHRSDEEVFNFLSDFRNFARFIPNDKIKNWNATSDSCNFEIAGIGKAGLKLVEKVPKSYIKISSEGSIPVNLMLSLNINYIDANTSELKLTVEPDASPIMLTMIKSTLQNFVDMLIDHVENLRF
jgi:carbon monoxide dehydrogenase subunit G